MADGGPKPIDVNDPAYQAKVAKDAEDVVKLTAKLAVIAKLLPGPAGKVFAFAISGVEKTHEGKVRPTGDTLFNFLPAPFGYMPAEDFGLRKNFYLPPGASTYIPPIADRLGLGLPEQRVDDAERQNRIAQNSANNDLRLARQAVAGENVVTLQRILDRDYALTRAGVIVATSGASLAALQIAAQERINAMQRVAPVPTIRRRGLLALTPAQIAAAEAAGTLAIVSLMLLQGQNPPDP